jgi:ATP-dependent protease ClpP protease subunit
MADKITAERNTIARLLSESTGKEPSEVLSAMADERYFTAEQAVDFGLVDYVIT